VLIIFQELKEATIENSIRHPKTRLSPQKKGSNQL